MPSSGRWSMSGFAIFAIAVASLLGRRASPEEHADLARHLGRRIERTEHRVVAVRPQLGVVLARREAEVQLHASRVLAAEAGEPVVHVREDVRIADADERDGLVAADRRALELDRRLLGLLEDRALDARDPVADRGVHRGASCRACRSARAGGTGRRSRRACAPRPSSGSRRRSRRAGRSRSRRRRSRPSRRRRAGRSCTGCRTRRSSPRARSGPAAMPRPSAMPATEAVSVARPVSTRSAPAASAAVIGARAHQADDVLAAADDVLGERAGGLERGDLAGGERLEHGLARRARCRSAPS